MEKIKKIVESLFKCKEKNVYGFVVLQDFYKNICDLLNDKNVKPNSSFYLLSSLHENLVETFKYMDMNYLCENFHWFSFIVNVMCANELNVNENTKGYSKSEIDNLLLLCMLIGKRLSLCGCDDKKKWYEKLHEFQYTNSLTGEQKNIVSQCILAFLASQFYDKNNLIFDFFVKIIMRDPQNTSECHIRSFLLMSCFLYYLAKREENSIVEEIDGTLRLRSKKIVDKSKMKFEEVLQALVYRDKNLNENSYNVVDIFNKDFFVWMKKVLGRYEFLAEYGSKTFIMDDVVEEFISHCFIYMRCKNVIGTIPLQNVMDEKQAVSLYLKYNSSDGFKNSLDVFSNFFNIPIYKDFYLNYISELESVYKSTLLRNGLTSANEDCKNIEGKIQREMDSIFGDYPKDDCCNYETTVLCSSSTIPTHMTIEELRSDFIEVSLANLNVSLFQRMKVNQEANVNVYSRLSDDDILALIEKYRKKMYIGCDAPLQPGDICRYYKRYNVALAGLSKKIVIGHSPISLFVDTTKFRIFVKNVKITRSPATIENVDAIEVDGKYKYSPQGIELLFERSELEKYLSANTSVLKIKADVGYALESGEKVDFLIFDKPKDVVISSVC